MALLAPAVASDQEDAEVLAALRSAAMHDADSDPHRGVDAAIDCSHVLTIYKKMGDRDAICARQANFFWCTKRMNIELSILRFMFVDVMP